MIQSDKKLLVLDLDETLVHANDTPLAKQEDFCVGPYFVYLRPHLSDFITYALGKFDVGIWTASGEKYAAEVIERVFPKDSLRFLWSSQRCTLSRNWDTGEYRTIKKLEKLKSQGYKLEAIIAVDDTPSKYARSYGNLVAVQEYVGDENDNELLLLMRYLDYLSTVSNIRAVEKRYWRKEVL